MTNSDKPFTLVVRRIDGVISSHSFYTIKSARQFAKSACNNPGVKSIRVTDETSGETVVLYEG